MTRLETLVRRLRPAVLGGARSTAALLCWSIVYFVVVLAAMTGLIRVVTGWDAVVIESGSMQPTLNVGDVLFLDDPPETAVGQRSVITFERADGELVTHRVFETDPATPSYITKGDANPSPDVDIVDGDQVVGVGTLVVPYVGLPVVWLHEGDVIALTALGSVTFLLFLGIVVSVRTAQAPPASDERSSRSGRRSITRVRVLVAFMVSLFTLSNAGQFEAGVLGLTRWHILLVTVAGLGASTAISQVRTGQDRDGTARRLAIVELAIDSLVVLTFVTASGTDGIGWILLVLPIIEAAIYFRLTGAFVHWVVMSSLSIGALFWTNQRLGTTQSASIVSLETLVDRLGVLLMVVIPGSYLAEQLLGDVLVQRRATEQAHDRSELIERVTASGRDVARLDTDLFPTLVRAALPLGFDAADCWSGNPIDGWRELAVASNGAVALPIPEQPGSGLHADELVETEVFIDADDPDELATLALGASGLACVMRITLATTGGIHVVLRVASATSGSDPASQAMALRLLSGQAAVALQNGQLLSELRRTHAELDHQAKYDSLTELANRKHFLAELDRVLTDDAIGPESVTVMFLDLDGFKGINDRIGHHAGDELLRLVARRLQAAAGPQNLVARLGGDEFTILSTAQDVRTVDGLAEIVHEHLSAPFDLPGETVTVGVSVGIARSERDVASSEMLRRADVAMYAAKSSRQAQATQTYSVQLDQVERRQQQLVAALPEAIRHDTLGMQFQPIVSTATGRIEGAEALVRWTHDVHGPISPPEIVELAELADAVDELNAWICHTAITGWAACVDPADDDMLVALNVSPHELELDSLLDNLHAALAATHLRPSQVVVELSERIVAEALHHHPNIERLVSDGFRIALDDFGEGQTSLAHLRGFPIDFLKLDRNFVLHAGESEQDRTILRSVVGLAHDLGLCVIAEGVENIEQHGIVTKASADYVQGYGLYRPMPIEAVRDALRSSHEAAAALDFDAELASIDRITGGTA